MTSSDARADPHNPIAANDAIQIVPTEAPSVQTAPPVETMGSTNNDVPEDVTSVRVLDECLVGETCIDRFLWVLYQRVPKVDQIEVYESKEVTVTRRGRIATVVQRVAKSADSDFA